MFFATMLNRITKFYLFSCLLCLSLALLGGCKKAGGAMGPGGMMGGLGGPTKPPVVVIDTVKQNDVPIYRYPSGRTVASKEVDIRTRVSGFLEQLFFEPGAIVKEGDRLALVEQATYQIALESAKAELANSVAQSSLAKSTLDREKLLLDRGSGTLEQVQTQQANYDVALAAIDRANASIHNAELNLQYTDLRSPISGKTTKNLVDIGNFVSPTGAQSVLLSITQLDPMFVEFQLSDREFIDLKERAGLKDAFHQAATAPAENPDGDGAERPVALVGMPIDVSLMTGVDVFKFDFNIQGKIVAVVDNQIGYGTAQITLRAEIQNPLVKTNGTEDYLIYPGQVCRVRLLYETVQDAVLVREGAILTDLDTKYVLVVSKRMYQPKDALGKPKLDENGKEIPPYEADIVERRDIVLGRLLDSQMRIVTKGLAPGESYIVHGLQRVRVGMECETTPFDEYEKSRKNGGK
ncbi:MAG: efflux RND transporter periplasmic adaptor subunit [Planctomycetaceae bacterium]|jgi:RND family efflux transporter MFP subunit|nr:efflux RND transporter periplasmic adaptor subunit [Planctomycetaceae bacterium]